MVSGETTPIHEGKRKHPAITRATFSWRGLFFLEACELTAQQALCSLHLNPVFCSLWLPDVTTPTAPPHIHTPEAWQDLLKTTLWQWEGSSSMSFGENGWDEYWNKGHQDPRAERVAGENPCYYRKGKESVQTQAMQIPQQAWRLQNSQKKSLHCNPGLKSTSHLGMAGKLPLQEKQTRVREILRNFCCWLCWMWKGNSGLPCKKTDSKHFHFYIFHLITDYFWTL